MNFFLYDLSHLPYSKQEEIWSCILEICISISDKARFNILYFPENEEYYRVLKNIESYYLYSKKLYKGTRSIEFNINDLSINFIKSLNFNNLKNNFLEDISFLKDDEEFLATITHEGYIICDASVIDPSFFKMLGVTNISVYNE